MNYEEILPPLMAGLKQARAESRTPFFVRYGRVKIEDQIGEILGAKVSGSCWWANVRVGSVRKPLLLRRLLAAYGYDR
ncbi:ethanolamine ammonia-lyase light chain EutC [Shigella flexneri]